MEFLQKKNNVILCNREYCYVVKLTAVSWLWVQETIIHHTASNKTPCDGFTLSWCFQDIGITSKVSRMGQNVAHM